MEIINNIAYIDGKTGIYDGKIKDAGTRYGRNSYANHLDYLKAGTEKPDIKYPDFKELEADTFEQKTKEMNRELNKLDEWLKSLPPVNFVRKYMPNVKNGEINGNALMGEAYEELGQKTEIGVEELNETMKEAFSDVADVSAADLDNNGKIDLAEYSASVLLSDMLSTDSNELSFENINGTITNMGENAALPYINKKNKEIAGETYRAIYDHFKLDKVREDFLAEPNNLIKN